MSKTYRTIPDWARPGSYYYKWVTEVDENGLNCQGKKPGRNKYVNGHDGVVGSGVSDGYGAAPRKGWKEIAGSASTFFKRYASKRDRKLAKKRIKEEVE